MTDKETVLVTGASGYIAMQIVLQLLQGGYTVRGSIRSLDKEQHLRDIFARHVDANDRLEFVELNLLSDTGWSDAVQGCTYMLHTASPLPSPDIKDENELIQPALEGTQRALKAAATANIKRVVLTSSGNAILDPTQYTPTRVFTEADWAEPGNVDPYSKSKIMAERAAWDIAKQHEIELVAICPGLVLGPILEDRVQSSVRVIADSLKRELPAIPNAGFPIVDIRDVADAHIIAMTHPQAVGKRFICSTEYWTLWDLVSLLNESYGAQGYQIPMRRLPNFALRFFGLFDKSLEQLILWLGKDMKLSNEQLTSTFGVEPRPVKQAILDTAQSLIDKKLV